MLASDVNNPDFVGAQAPDAALYVEFFWHEAIDKWASEIKSAEQGKRVTVKLDKRPFVRIMRPGDKNSIIEEAVRNDHKHRFPERWLQWQLAEGLIDGGENIPGWKIEEWPYLEDKKEQLRELKFLRFHTVELLAGASDAQVQGLGIGGLGLREMAKQALRDKMQKDVRDAVQAKDTIIADQGAAIEVLKKQMADMIEAMTKPKGK